MSDKELKDCPHKDYCYHTKSDGWIPVSRGMPEDGQDVSFVVRVDDKSIHKYLDGRILGGRYRTGKFGGFGIPGMMLDAYAWKPIEPYKGE